MILQGRNLEQGQTGMGVAALHEDLVILGYEVSAQERDESRFGGATFVAVRAFQTEYELEATGKVDEGTAKALVTAVAKTTWTVSGLVSNPGVASVASLVVDIVDKNVGGDDPVACGETDASGSYQVSATISPAILRQRHKTSPDLQARVSARTADGTLTFLAASGIAYDAAKSVTLDVALPAGSPGLPSEFETLAAALNQVYPGDLSKLQETAQRQDISLLAARTGFDARAVAMVALAAQLSGTAINAAPPTSGAKSAKQASKVAATKANSVHPAFYYALLRAGAPADPARLFQVAPSTAAAIWTQAASQGVIPAALGAQIPAATTTFQDLAASQALAGSAGGGGLLPTQVSSVLASTADQSRYAGLLAQYAGNWTAFWPAVQTAFGAGAAAKLQTLGQLSYLTLGDAALATSLAATAQPDSKIPADLSKLVRAGLYQASAWAPLIGASVPAGVPGATPADQAANYAAFLAAQVKLAFPTATLADQVAKGAMPVAGPPSVAREVADFLSANQTQFAIGSEPVEAFLARMTGAGTSVQAPSTDALAQIKRLQRVYQLTDRDEAMAVLLNHGLDSAFAVVRYDAAGFARAMGPQLGGADAAAAVHARAKQVFGTVLNLAAAYGVAQRTPALGGAWDFVQDAVVPAQSAGAPQATLQTLFGDLDYCNCSDCSSILSPAAYFVDLLRFLDQPAPSASLENPQAELFARRPDLPYLALSCANTNTALPYIDVVNETLEAYVAGGLSLAGYQGFDTAVDINSADLIAAPQNINDAAYATLQTSFFPAPLPFNRHLELLRRHMQALGAALPDAMTRLRASDAATNTSTPVSYGWNEILIERLGISPDEYRVFVDPTLRLGDLWGLPRATGSSDSQWDAAALTALQNMDLQSLSLRTSVSYADLVAILKSRFVNPASALIERLEALGVGFAAIEALHDSSTASEVQSFIGGLPAGLDYTQYGGSDGQAVVDWLTGPNYAAIMGLIVIVETNSAAPNDCSGAALGLRYATPDTTNNLVSAPDYIRLVRFVRLWRKLQAKLGLTDDRAAIHATDALLAAVYPAGAATPEVGFTTTLGRAGFVVELLSRLGLDGASLTRLLACWAPIDAIGARSLYASLFLSPAILQEDPGAQAVVVTPPVAVGDVLTTTIEGVNVAYTVTTADLTTGPNPVTVAEAVAANIAAAIDATSSPIPQGSAYVGQALNQRFHAAAQGASVVVVAGFDLTWSVAGPAGGTLAAAAVDDPTLQTATVDGAPAAGQAFHVDVDSTPIAYVAQAGDSAATVAAGLVSAINAQTAPHSFTGLPLNSLLVASAAGAIVTVRTAGAGPAFSLAGAIQLAVTANYVTAAPVPAQAELTLSGVPAAGDIATLTLDGAALTYILGAADAVLPTLALNLATVVNGSVTPDPTTGLPFGQLLRASAAGAVVTLMPIDPATAFTVSATVTGAAAIAVAGPDPASQSATVTGAFPTGAVLTTTIDGAALYYTVAPADTPASIAGAIAGLVNATALPDPNSGLPLTTLLQASSAGATVTINARNTTTAFTLQVLAAQGGYAAGRLTPPFADDGYGAYLADQSQTLFAHQPAICAACSLTGAEFAEIAAALQFDAERPLTLDTVSAIFRTGWLAHALKMSVPEFLALRTLCGLDPFLPLDLAPAPPAEPPAIALVRLAQALLAAGLAPIQALYLMWNQDLSGALAPGANAVAILAQSLRSEFAAVEAQFTPQDDPTGAVAQQLMSLVYGVTDTAFFFSLLDQTFTVSIPYAYASPFLPQAVIAASGGLLAYDDTAKTLTVSGWLTAAAAAPIEAAAGADASLVAAVGQLAASSQQVVVPFFAKYPELQPLYDAYRASAAPIQGRRNALLAGVLPTLVRLRKIEQALAEISAEIGCDASYANALLQDATIIAADGDATQAAVTDLTGIEAGGLTAEFFLGNDLTQPPDQTVPVVGPLTYPASGTAGPLTWVGSDQLPPGSGGSAIAGRWSGFITPLQSGDYDIAIAADAGAAVTLMIDDVSVPVAIASGIWSSQTPVALAVGDLTKIVLTVGGVTSTVALGWRSAPGLGWTVVPATSLYPTATIASLGATYIRFLKAVSLASALELKADEMAWLAKALGPGGQSWINLLTATPGAAPSAATAASLTDVLTGLLDFARLKAAISPKDERLMAVVQDPGALLPSGQSALLSLTGWSQASVNALLARFFGSTSSAPLGDVTNFARVFDAITLVRTCRVSASVLTAATTSAPTPTAVAALQSALRASYAAQAWLTLAKPINDALRRLQRDALVAFILQSADGAIKTADDLYALFLIDPSTEPAVLTSRIRLALSAVQLFVERISRSLEANVSSADIDPNQWAAMKRYRLWQANREVFLWPENWLDQTLRDDPSPVFQQVMSSLLQSDITDDAATSAYLDYLSGLADVAKLEPCGFYYVPATSDADEVSYVVARSFGAHRKYYFRQLRGGSWTPWSEVPIDCEDMPLTPIVWGGRLFLFWLKAHKDVSGAIQKVNQNAQGGGQVTPDSAGAALSNGAGANQSTSVQATLWWTEFYNGKWQPTKSSDPNRPTGLGDFDSAGPFAFEAYRSQIRIVPATCTGDYPFVDVAGGATLPNLPNDVLILAISSPNEPFPLRGDRERTWTIPNRFGNGRHLTFVTREGGAGFLLHNTHSAPIRLEDIAVNGSDLGAYLDVPSPSRDFVVTGGPSSGPSGQPPTWGGGSAEGALTVRYFDSAAEIESSAPASQPTILKFHWLPRTVDTQPGLADARNSPFLYEDRRDLFYVSTTVTQATFRHWPAPGLVIPASTLASMSIEPLQVLPTSASKGAITVTLPNRGPISYGGTPIFAAGSAFASPPVAAS
jgi:hypothetical protein